MTAPGSRVAGRYLLRSRLGGGAMGAVWLARDELLGRDVAVKQVIVPVGSDPEATAGHREAAMREGRIAARLTHPHAVSVYDMVDDGGTPWLVMEYLPSRSLATVLAERGRLPVGQVAQIGAQVADALVAVHAAGVVHRDVKPGNILIGEGPRSDGLVKITDFGISRARGDVSLTQTGVVKGTPAYLAPEVARGREPDEASDVFSLGATVYACLEGTPPFGMTENPLEMLHRVAGGDVARPRSAGPLSRPLMRMLHNDPTKRPTMAQVRDQLAKLAAGKDRDVTEVLTARTPLAPTLADLRPGAAAGGPGTAAELPAPSPGGRPAGSGTPATSPEADPPAEPDRGLVAGADARGTAAPAGARAVPAADTRSGPHPAASASPTGAAPRRRRLLALAALLVLALVGTLGGVWLTTRGDDGGTQSAAGSSAPPTPSSSPPSETEQETTQPETTAPTTEETAPSTPTPTPTPPSSTPPPAPSTPAGPAPGSAAEIEQAISSYYALLPGNPSAAWELTGPRLRAEIGSRADYLAFWNKFSSVSRGPVQAQDGSLVASMPVTFTERDGSVSAEQHEITLVRGDDGRLLIDYDLPV
ncbi:serine/threonine-protein kinase [Modestobacter italicus]|uniref:serine/threonine-protein kinase n=1 Tax=Modestobacter italicus (strain DSM 44449 / CECT 9708 / BC 501) TaxID=2732864 RepID=UPI001C98326F|nr:serine/threonine-protein kinase [Modestobacter italicus]